MLKTNLTVHGVSNTIYFNPGAETAFFETRRHVRVLPIMGYDLGVTTPASMSEIERIKAKFYANLTGTTR